MAITWTPLDLGLSESGKLLPLLISKSFEADSYRIHLTDLTHVWSEQLDSAAILGRAEEEQTSIDPSESSNLQILLDKLHLALSSGPNTTLKLHVPSSPGRARPTLSLSLAIELPGDLAPLVWPVHLSAAPQSVLTSHLTVPLLQAQYESINEVDGLLEVVKEKDRVIQKLLDRLELQGTELGQVFPQANARSGRKVDRKQAEEKVRGLGVFDMEMWKRGLGGEKIDDTNRLIQSVFWGGKSLDLSEAKSAGTDNWWESLKGTTIGLSNKSAAIGTKIPTKENNNTRESAVGDDFQVQKTPSPKTSQSVTLNESTASEDDDDDLNAPSQRSQLQVSKSLKKLGGLKGKKQSTKPSEDSRTSTEDEELPLRSAKNLGMASANNPPSHPVEDEMVDDTDESPEPSKKTVEKVSVHDSAEDSTEDSEPHAPKPTTKRKEPSPVRPASLSIEDTTEEAPSNRSLSKSSSPEPAPKRKGGLGQLQGKKKEASPSPSSSAAEEAPKLKKGKFGQLGGRKKQATPASSQEAAVPKRKLGALGGRNKAAYEENGDVEESEERGRAIKVEKEETPPPRETSEERVERRRAQLKRELDEKANAPAKKKKRKF